MLPLTPRSHATWWLCSERPFPQSRRPCRRRHRPTKSARTESNRRLALIRSRLSPLSYGPPASAGTSASGILDSQFRIRCHSKLPQRLSGGVRPEGFEPPPCRLKVCCAAVTPRPHVVWCIRFHRCSMAISCLLVFLLSSSPRRSRTFVSALSERRPKPLDDRAVLVGMVELEPAVPARIDDSVVPGHVGCCSPTSRMSVRTVGFEPTISWPPARHDNQTSLRSASLINYRPRLSN